MEKRIITNATLEALLDSNLVFNKDTFKTKLNSLLFEHELELHEKTVQELLKTLQAKDYIDIENEHFVKTEKTLLNQNNKQRKLYELLVDEYGKEFDNDYIKHQYNRAIKQEERTPTLHHNVINQSFDVFVKELKLDRKNNSNKDMAF